MDLFLRLIPGFPGMFTMVGVEVAVAVEVGGADGLVFLRPRRWEADCEFIISVSYSRNPCASYTTVNT
jgi:hypothetical protein